MMLSELIAELQLLARDPELASTETEVLVRGEEFDWNTNLTVWLDSRKTSVRIEAS